MEVALDHEERRIDLAEQRIDEALKCDDSRRRDAAAMFVLRNTARAKRRGWIVSASAGVDATVNTAPREIHFRWRTDEDDKRDAERAEAERLREGGKLIEHESGPEPLNED
jgi:hypothetical protein